MEKTQYVLFSFAVLNIDNKIKLTKSMEDAASPWFLENLKMKNNWVCGFVAISSLGYPWIEN